VSWWKYDVRTSGWTSRAVSAVSTGGGLLCELCPSGSMMSGRQDGLAEQCPQSVQVGVYYASCVLVEV
jgi:hypothetical protein